MQVLDGVEHIEREASQLLMDSVFGISDTAEALAMAEQAGWTMALADQYRKSFKRK